ncbi:hypothetical protein REJC140_03843 [Pseudorhizobium endolithicum]|uniref:DUF6894 domain-containing protein n=1 Tax=Pseudorhizobium endolithicum TaxID=1191678 RepID=A0ABN7JRM8_9HYPH|nr:hypothetical protein [Pseudorhizobium endolithicum]CAD7044623.1 hypothetical protein REJC140_03843 [Pseudorhizobium endolithicum]
MPRYFFDLTNGDGLTRDEMGSVFPESREPLLKEVSRILTDLARDELPGTDSGEITVTVRDERGCTVLVGSLDFQTRWRPTPEPG